MRESESAGIVSYAVRQVRDKSIAYNIPEQRKQMAEPRGEVVDKKNSK